jgi:hypothetical protein
MNIVEALGGSYWFNIYCGLILTCLAIIAMSLMIIACKI